MELDPHQLIEGMPHRRRHAVGAVAERSSTCRESRWHVAQERLAHRPQRAPTPTSYVGENILGSGYLLRHRACSGAPGRPSWSGGRRRFIEGLEAAAAPAPRTPSVPGQPAASMASRRSSTTSSAVQPAVADAERCRLRPSARDLARRAHGRHLRGVKRPGGHQRHHDVPRDDLRRRVLPGHPRRQRSSSRSSPAAARRPGSCPTSADLPYENKLVNGRFR